MPKKSIRAVGPRDIMSKLMSKIRARRPKSDELGTFEVSRSTDRFVSQVKFYVKTGLTTLDRNIIGIPFGRITEVYGPEESGKTALVWQTMYHALNKRDIYEKTPKGLKRISDDCIVVGLYVDVEGSMDDNPVMEVDGEKVDCLIANCDRIDQMFKLIEGTIDDVDKIAAEEKKECFLIEVVDTVAGLTTKEEMSAEWDKEDYARQPKFLRKGFRVVARKLVRRNVALICVNQIGDNIKAGGKRGGAPIPTAPDDAFVVSGGKALAYWSRLRLYIWKHNPNYKLTDRASSPAGFVGGWYVKKINQGPKPKTQGRFAMLYKGNERISAGLNDLMSKLEHMLYMKVAERNEKGIISFHFSKYGVPMTTFTAAPVETKTLEDNDDTPDEEVKVKRKVKDPTIDDRISFYTFYDEHKVDVDALFDKAIELTQRVEGIDAEDPTPEEDEDDYEDEDEVENEEAE